MFGTDISNQDNVDLHMNKAKAKMDVRVQSANPVARGTNIQIQHQGVAAGPSGQDRFNSSYR